MNTQSSRLRHETELGDTNETLQSESLRTLVRELQGAPISGASLIPRKPDPHPLPFWKSFLFLAVLEAHIKVAQGSCIRQCQKMLLPPPHVCSAWAPWPREPTLSIACTVSALSAKQNYSNLKWHIHFADSLFRLFSVLCHVRTTRKSTR